MSSLWILVTQAGTTQRYALTKETTSVGGGGADVPLDGVGGAQLRVEREPLRVTHTGNGAPPFCGGAPLTSREIAPGEHVEWAGARLEFEREASLEEVAVEPAPATPPAPAPAGGFDAPTWQRVRAGLLVEMGHADKRAVKRWQQAVVDGNFRVDAAAQELTEGARNVDDSILRDRAGRLMRDFLMAPLTRGVRGAGRSVRQGAKGFVAMLLSQALALLVYSLIVLLSMLVLRYQGTGYDAFFDRILALFGLEAGGGSH